jgi:hypothetical protein
MQISQYGPLPFYSSIINHHSSMHFRGDNIFSKLTWSLAECG